MRHNDARKWLHAVLDLLPVILIPVFMIYSHRHDLSTDITIQQEVYKDFYQGVKNGKPNSLDYLVYDIDDVDLNISDNYLDLTSQVPDVIPLTFESNLVINYEDYLYITLTTQNEYDIETTLYIDEEENVFVFEDYIVKGKTSFRYKFTGGTTNLLPCIYFDFSNDDSYQIKDLMVFNLTTIFGSGNEPTIEVFESYLTQDYYEFGSNQVKVGTTDVQAKNNDIMSVFMDSFNTSVNKYFNMGNVFNMTSVYNWFNTNIFGGNAPVVIYSVWNIVLYEFVMDLLFLLYALFMWFIDMLKRLMEKPLDSIK